MEKQSRQSVAWCMAICMLMMLTANAQPLRIQWAKPAIQNFMELFPEVWDCLWDREHQKLMIATEPGDEMWNGNLWMCIDLRTLKFIGFAPRFYNQGRFSIGYIGMVDDSTLLFDAFVYKSYFRVWYDVPSGEVKRYVALDTDKVLGYPGKIHLKRGLVFNQSLRMRTSRIEVQSIEGEKIHTLVSEDETILNDRPIKWAIADTRSNLNFCVVVYTPEPLNEFPFDTVTVLIRKIRLDTWEVAKEFTIRPVSGGIGYSYLSPSGKMLVLDHRHNDVSGQSWVLDLETGQQWRVGPSAIVLPDDRTVAFVQYRPPLDLHVGPETLYVARLDEQGGYQILRQFVIDLVQPLAFSGVYVLDASPTGDTLYLCAADGIYQVNWKSGEVRLFPYWRWSLYIPQAPPEYYAGEGLIELSPQGRYLRVTQQRGVTEIFFSETGKAIDHLTEQIKVAAYDGEGELANLWYQLRRYPYAFAFSWDDQMVAIGGYPQTDQVSIYRLPQWSLQYRYQVDWDITAVDFSPDGQYVAIGGKDGRIRICDYYSGNVRRTLQAPPSGEVALVRYCRSGRHLYVVLQNDEWQELWPWMVDVDTGEWKDFGAEVYPAFNYELDIWQAHSVFTRGKLLVRKVSGSEWEWYDCEAGKYLRIVSEGIPLEGTTYVLRSGWGYKMEIVDTVTHQVVAEYDRFLPKQDTLFAWTFWWWINLSPVRRQRVRWDQLVYGSGGWIAGVMKEPPALFVLHWTPPEPTEVERNRGRAEALPVGWYWVEVYNVLGQRVSRQWEFVGRGGEGIGRKELPQGVYFLVVRNERGEVLWKKQYSVGSAGGR